MSIPLRGSTYQMSSLRLARGWNLYCLHWSGRLIHVNPFLGCAPAGLSVTSPAWVTCAIPLTMVGLTFGLLRTGWITGVLSTQNSHASIHRRTNRTLHLSIPEHLNQLDPRNESVSIPTARWFVVSCSTADSCAVDMRFFGSPWATLQPTINQAPILKWHLHHYICRTSGRNHYIYSFMLLVVVRIRGSAWVCPPMMYPQVIGGCWK